MIRRTVALPLLAISLILLIAAPLGVLLPTWASQPSASAPLGLPVHPAVAAIWTSTDGQLVDGAAQRAWLWGPSALAMTVEYDADSPTGLRQMIYFDKGRLDIVNPSATSDDPWFVSGGLLVSEMISGEVQFGHDDLVHRTPAEIALTGDLDQPDPVTYASFARMRMLQQADHPGDDALLSLSSAPTTPARVGGAVLALLEADGAVIPNGAPGSQVLIGAYDSTTGHNIAAPFAAWDAAQPFPATWLLGHPISEPYWIDTVVLGTPKRVMVQAFERRVLTYTPDNPPAWQVEANNSGTHYRLWRGLSQPSDPSLTGLASLEPSGEEIVAAATANGVDPYLLAAVARVASGGNPLATLSTGGAGLLGVHPLQGGDPTSDPFTDAVRAAQQLSTTAGGDLRAQLAAYFQPANPDLGDPNLAQLVDATVAALDQLHATYTPTSAAGGDAVTSLGQPGAARRWAAAFDASWWENSLNWYASWGGAVAGWQADPNGYYCAHPDYAPGDQLRLVANGVTIDCTIGAQVPSAERADWHNQWAVELNDAAFNALHLDRQNSVTVAHVPPGNKTSVGEIIKTSGVWIGAGQAAYYSPTYDRAWWEWAMSYYNDKGVITPGWSLDPNGYYCVHPNYLPGDRLRLVANGVTIDCTVGDMVADQDVYNWRQHFAVELGWDTFTALGLQNNNSVQVYYLGSAPKPERYGEPPTATETPTPEPTEQPVETPQPTAEPTETAPPVATPVDEATAEPTVVPAEPTAVPTQASDSEPVDAAPVETETAPAEATSTP